MSALRLRYMFKNEYSSSLSIESDIFFLCRISMIASSSEKRSLSLWRVLSSPGFISGRVKLPSTIEISFERVVSILSSCLMRLE